MENFYCFDEAYNYIGSTVDDAITCRYLYAKNGINTIEDLGGTIIIDGIFENNDLLYRFDKETDRWEEILAGNSYDTILKYIKDKELIQTAYTTEKPKKTITAYQMECASTVGVSLSEKEKTYTLYIAFTDTELIKIAQGSLMEISDTMNTLEKICNANKIIKFIIE